MRPSQDERKAWYIGIDSRMESASLLIARSSTFPFQPFTDETQDAPEGSPRKERKRKGIYTVGTHKIGAIYDSHLRHRVREILSNLSFKWQTIDVVRVGYNHDDPPVILITVDINNVNEVIAEEAVKKIHDLMIDFHLPDVHAEVKTGRLFEQAKYDQDEVYPLDLLRVPKMGASIGRANSESAGSLCLYLKIDGSNYALTCQHVATTSLAAFTPGEDPDIVILQPARKDLRKYEFDRDEGIEDSTLAVEKFKAEKLNFKEGEMPPISVGREKEAKDSQDKLDRARPTS